MSPLGITVWPEGPLPLPKVQVAWGRSVASRFGFIEADFDVVTGSVNGEWVNAVPESTSPSSGLTTIPDELYLRQLRDLDLSSADEIARFCTQYGDLRGTDWSEVLPAEWLESPEPTPKLNKSFEQQYPFLREIREQTEEYLESGVDDAFHVEEFRIRAKLLRDMTRTWLELKGVLTRGDVLYGWESKWWGVPTSLEAALSDFLIPVLNRGLAPFHFRAELRSDLVDRPRFEKLYNVVCLQLANDISTNAVYHRCANAVCGRIFNRHIGGARHAPHSEGALCCGPSCTNSRNQRMFRDRQKRARELSRNGWSAERIADELGSKPETIEGWLNAGSSREGSK